MNWLQIVIVLYGLINIGGGIMGYMKAQSMMSLIVGVSFGVAAVAAGLIALRKPAIGYRLAGVLSLVLLGFWVYRIIVLMQTQQKTTMAIMNLALSAVVFVLLGASHFAAQKKKSELA